MNIKTKPEPYCPDCGARMVLKRPRKGQSWAAFWGCAEYTYGCRGSRDIREDGTAEDDEV